MNAHRADRNPATAAEFLLWIRSTAFTVLALTGWLMLESASPVFAQTPSARLSTESRNLANLLIKNALISVNQGNLTGNYTVLRDLASPGFRQLNTASDLGVIFSNLRKQKIDLSPIVLLEPVITEAKFAKEQQQLRFKGYFPSEPVQVQFELIFQMANPGGWMIHGISIGTATVEAKSRLEEEVAEEAMDETPAAATPPRSAIRPASAGKAGPPISPTGNRSTPAAASPTSARPKRSPATP